MDTAVRLEDAEGRRFESSPSGLLLLNLPEQATAGTRCASVDPHATEQVAWAAFPTIAGLAATDGGAFLAAW